MCPRCTRIQLLSNTKKLILSQEHTSDRAGQNARILVQQDYMPSCFSYTRLGRAGTEKGVPAGPCIQTVDVAWTLTYVAKMNVCSLIAALLAPRCLTQRLPIHN